MPRSPAETRQRIIQAADELFYSVGVTSVGVDDIARKAGVTKRTLYYHYSSKDELIAAYFSARDEPTLNRYKTWFDRLEGTLAEKIAGVFLQVAIHAQDPRWKGCGFARAAAELAGMPGHPAIAVASKHKHALERWLANLVQSHGVPDGQEVARQILVLLDGAITEILIHRDASYAHSAAKVAALLIKQAIEIHPEQADDEKHPKAAPVAFSVTKPVRSNGRVAFGAQQTS